MVSMYWPDSLNALIRVTDFITVMKIGLRHKDYSQWTTFLNLMLLFGTETELSIPLN